MGNQPIATFEVDESTPRELASPFREGLEVDFAHDPDGPGRWLAASQLRRQGGVDLFEGHLAPQPQLPALPLEAASQRINQLRLADA